MTRQNIKIRHPDWIKYSKPGESIAAFNRGLYPDCIAGWMLVVSLKHPLRAIYGSDFRAACALLWDAVSTPVRDFLLNFKWRKEIKVWTQEWEAEDAVKEQRNAARASKN